MLKDSLKVVDAVRQLKLTLNGGRTIADIRDPVELAFAIDALRRSLENFDERTGSGRGRPGMLSRPDFATPPQMDDDGYVADLAAIEGEAGSLDIDAELTEDEIEDLEEREEADRQKSVDGMLAGMAGVTPVIFPLRAGLRPSDIPDDEINGVFVADGTVEELEMGLDLIEDRLGFAVAKAGWSYRLKGLAEAARQAIGSLDLLVDKEREETWVAMPTQSFSDLMRHVTDVAVNHDLKISLPVPRPESVEALGRSPRSRSAVIEDDDIPGFEDDSLSPFDAAM
ncbi:hypothetical protein G6L37_03695 [Agrobacterium rubi]|nr:hypothetical protein [Agrobacterium rubi]NTF24455.1 hypothetical protein [Agrobacterium rubi]